MRIKTLLIATSLVIPGPALLAQNQTLPNGGFENWYAPMGTYQEPSGWFTLNFLNTFGFDETSVQSTDAHSGSSALLLESKGGSFSDIPGLICSNNMFDANGTPDFNKNLVPFNSSPTRLEFYFKSYPGPNDTSGGFILLSKWNSSKNKRDTVALARWRTHDTVAVYSLASVPFTYFSSVLPDSMSAIFSSSIDGFNPVTGSRLYLDDLKLVYAGTGISTPGLSKAPRVYPNPCTEKIYLDKVEPGSQIRLFNLMGQLMMSTKANNEETVLLLSDLKKGSYILEISSPAGLMKQNHTIIIQ